MPRKLLWLLLLALPASAANMRYSNWCQVGGQLVKISPKDSSPAKFQRSFPACTITVYLSGTLTPATIYSDALNTPLANPFTANSVNGSFFFYAADGRYDVNLSGTLTPSFTIGDVLFNTSTGGGGGPGTVTAIALTMPSFFTVSGSPVTTAGTFNVSMASGQASHQVLGTGAGTTFGSVSLGLLDLPFTYSGSTSKIATVSGSFISGNCLKSDGSGNVIDAGGICSGGTGVTSVGLGVPTGFQLSGSPVTTSGTLTFAMPTSWTTGDLLIGNGANSVVRLGIGANGTCLTSNGTTTVWGSCSGGGQVGTVTSVGLSLPGMFTVSGSPVTTSGTLTAVLASQSAHLWLGNATSGSAAPSFSSIGTGDLPFTYSNSSNTKLATTTGTLNTGHCVSIATGGDFVDAGAACASGSGIPGGTSNQIQYNNAGAFGGFTMSGDCTVVVGTGVITCTGTSGVPFAASATTNALNASNISSGTLPAGRLPAFTGDATAPTGTGALTLATVNSNTGVCGDATHYPVVTLNAKGLTTACAPQLVPSGGTPLWNTIGNPSGALALTMGTFTTQWTYNAATGTNTLQLITDTTGNTGTGILWRSTTASGSGAAPWQADANGVGWRVDSSGNLASVGFSGVPFRFTGLVGGVPPTPAPSNVTGYIDTTKLRLNSLDANGVVSDYVARLPGSISVTGQVAAISTANLCTTANCGTAGFYRVSAFLPSTLVCATPGPAVAGITIGWTDDASAKTLKLPGTGSNVTTGNVGLGDTTSFENYTLTIWSTGAAAITYATNYTACTTGTGTYSLRLSVERIF